MSIKLFEEGKFFLHPFTGFYLGLKKISAKPEIFWGPKKKKRGA